MFRPLLSLSALLLPAAIAMSVTAFGPTFGAGTRPDPAGSNADRQSRLAQLGQALFHDPSLSRNGTQSCATCHDPDHAFTDPRPNAVGGAVSVGDDGVSLGDRNTPTLTYAFLSPDFHQDAKGRYKGGQFWDGRADDLADQAGQPMLNPVEMGMPDRAAVVARLRDNPGYADSFAALFGADALDDVDRAFQGAAMALAAYQSTDEFAPFDSKFDRWKRGEVQPDPSGRIRFHRLHHLELPAVPPVAKAGRGRTRNLYQL
ncbi:cytochrome-c peroxidase [Paracoccus sp. DMF-8]|uniref:cytochrome-c peroxidase n=1 Tax=Paracoccus sp. DMF-8 TaxID=3019445 RepID=UPI0023E45807|nr:cytochrome-c peroxidase [Paracoccus sp. DMF-8]MDF3608030.1 cytochrome-c peroxidase [Paracoccus sp. DMF-8]